MLVCFIVNCRMCWSSELNIVQWHLSWKYSHMTTLLTPHILTLSYWLPRKRWSVMLLIYFAVLGRSLWLHLFVTVTTIQFARVYSSLLWLVSSQQRNVTSRYINVGISWWSVPLRISGYSSVTHDVQTSQSVLWAGTDQVCNAFVIIIIYYGCHCHDDSCQLIMVDFSEPCLVLRDLLCRHYGVRNPSLCGLRYEGEQ